MILDTIAARKREEVATLYRKGIQAPSQPVDPPRGFLQALLKASGVAIIAEAKKASPSKGLLCTSFDPQQIARNYQQGGAHALSVLTDRDFFQGSIDFIPLVRSTVDLPVLRKDFIVDQIQVQEAAQYGADAILLIAALLDTVQMRDLRQQAESLGMDVLIEVHDAAEVDQALAAGVKLLGINNRNLHDFSMDLETTFRLKQGIPSGIPVVSESGISSRADMLRLKAAGVQAALIGESLMRSAEQGKTLQDFLNLETVS
jgi:indole-3-glycerol phosphate synthase